MALVIVAALAAIGVPRYLRSLDRYRLDAAARRVELDLALARERATAQSAPVSITFSVDPAPSEYTMSGLDDPDRPGTPYVVRLHEDPYHATITSASFGGDGTLSFNGYAIPDDGGQLIVAVGSAQRIITVASATSLDPID